MRSSYNNKKIMAAIAAAAMFGVGPAMAATTIHVNNTTSKQTQSVNYRTPDVCDPSVAISVSGGNIVAAQQNYKNPSDVMDYKCDDGVIQTITANSNLDGIVTAEPLFASFDANASILDVKNTDTKESCPADYIMDNGECYKVNVLTAAKVNVESQRKNANVTSSNATEAKDDASCPDGYSWKRNGYSGSYACRWDYNSSYTNNPKCPAGYSHTGNWGSSSNSLDKACQKLTCDNGFILGQDNKCYKYTCDDGYTYSAIANDPVTNACYTAAREVCPSGYEEVAGGIGSQACSMISHTSLTTDARVYVTEITRYKNCTTEAATQSASGTVVKYAEADSALCMLNDSYNEFTLTGSTTEFGVVVAVNDVTVNLDNASIASNKGAGISFEDGINATLKFKGTTNGITGFDGFAGIAKTAAAGILTIDGTDAENVMTVTGGKNAAGIGGNSGQTIVKGISILAGNITANGGINGGAGIGGGEGGSASNITIGAKNDPFVFTANDNLALTAHGNDGGAGIGGGARGGAENLVFNDGFIYAEAHGSQYVTAAIGAGASASCKDIVFNNGVIKANGGALSSGIGTDGLDETTCTGIVINNGSINAQAGAGATTAKAIGKGDVSVKITGGSIKAADANRTSYDNIANPIDAQNQPVHRIDIPATKDGTALFIRSTEKNMLGEVAAVKLQNIFVNGGDWDNGKFFPTKHLTVGDVDPDNSAWVFLGENEEHDVMVNPTVTEGVTNKVVSSGKTSRIKWASNQSKYIFNLALLNSVPHDFLVYNGYEQRVKVDEASIWMLNHTETLSTSAAQSESNGYFTLENDASITNANVSCLKEDDVYDYETRSVAKSEKDGAPENALYCKPAGFLKADAPENVYTMTAKDDNFYGAAKHEKFMLPYVLDNMDETESIEPQHSENDPIALTAGFDHLIYNGSEQTQEVTSVTLLNKTHYVTDKFNNYALKEGTDYEVSDNKQTDASKQYRLTVSAKGTNFVGEAHRNFVIKPFDLANAKFTFNPDSLVYNMGEQTQKVDSMFICAGETVDESCYKLGTNNKDLYEISGNAATNAGEYNAKVAKVCVDEDDFCSNVTNEATPAYTIAKFPADSLKIAFASADQDTMVYNGEERTQKFEVSLKTLYKEPVEVAEDAEEGAPTFEYVEVSGLSASSTVVTNYEEEFTVEGDTATNAGKYTLTITAKDEANFEGAKSYDWRIGARDLAGNVWQRSQRNPKNPTSQNNVATICENYQKCVNEAEGFTPSADVAKYGCRAVYPCDWGFEGYAKASVTPDYRSTTFNAEVLVNEIKNVKFSNVVELAETDYVILTADSIKDHEADFIYNGSKTLSNTHLNVRGNDQFKDYCIRHVHTDGSGNKLVCHNPYMSNSRIGYYSDDGRRSYECTEEYADYGADEMGTSDYCASFETQEACDAGKSAASRSNVSTNTERCYDYHIGENTMVEKIYIAVGGVGNFKGIDTASYVINPADIGENKATIVFANNLTYNAKVQEKVISELTLGDFRIAGDIIYKNFVIKGNVESEASDNGYNMVITGIKNYKGTAQAKWGIAQYDITGADVTPMFNKVLTYNPDPLADDQIQKVDSAFFVIGDTTVKLTYSSSSKSVKDAGNYTIDLQGTGNFTGTYAAEFTVAPFDILKAGYQVAVTSDAYVSEDGDPTKLHVDYPVYNDGETITQKFAVWTGAKTLNEKTGEKVNYTYTGNTATQVGSYNIVVTGQGNYTGTISTTWVILDKEAVLVTVELKNDTVVYDGQEHVWGGKDIIKSATYVLAGNQSADPSPFDVSDLVVSENVSVKCTNVNDDCSSTVGAEDITVKNHGASSAVIPNPSYKLVITPAPVTVAVAGKTENVTFDNEEHKFAGYDVTIPEAWTEFLKAESFSCTGCDPVAGKDAGEYALGLAKEKFANANGNFDVTFDVTDGKLVIEKAVVPVKIIGNTETKIFNGEQQSLKGFSLGFGDASQSFVTVDSIIYKGDSSVVGVNAGEYAMNLDSTLFESTSKNYVIKVAELVDGKLTISPAPIEVKVSGHAVRKSYEARTFTASGFEIDTIVGNIEKAPFSKSDIALVNGAIAEVSAENVKLDSDGKVDRYMMGLAKENFASRNSNYNVTFSVETDGFLQIDPVDVVVTVTGERDSIVEDGKKHFVTGFTVSATDKNFGVNDYEFKGKATAAEASAKEPGVSYMNLADSMFSFKGNNYTGKFIIKDGYIKIVPQPDAIQTVLKSDVKVRAIESGIVVDNANGKAISVFTMNGKTVYSSMRGANTFGSTTINVPKGMYIVKVGSAAQRVNVK